ncbi:MAG: 6-hydroxymethylpterin diphosphokinase MptE-like protein, partial [Spirochaetota bacterium]
TKTNLPVVIAASGLSLEDSLKVLHKIRDTIQLWALPSALPALFNGNLQPDLVVSTDPGYYAAMHLRYLEAGEDVPVSMPLSSAKTGVEKDKLVCVLSQNTFFENAVINAFSIPAESIPSNGTVAGTALELALKVTAGPVVFSGLDFCYRDILSHSRPHGFEALVEKNSNRFEPFYGRIYARAQTLAPKYDHGLQIRTSLPVETYAEWFRWKASGEPKRIFRVNPSPINLEPMVPLNDNELISMCNNLTFKEYRLVHSVKKSISLPEKKVRIKAILGSWKVSLNQTMSELSKSKKIEILLRNRTVYELIYYCDLPGFTQIRKSLRQEGVTPAVNCSLSVLNGINEFLSSLDVYVA